MFLFWAFDRQTNTIHQILKYGNYFAGFEPFFYPVIHIRPAEAKDLSHTSTAYSGVICFNCLLANFLGIFSCFRVDRVVFFAILAKAPLCSWAILSHIYLIFCFSTFGTFSPRYFFCFSHISTISHSALFVQTLFLRQKHLLLRSNRSRVKKNIKKESRFKRSPKHEPFFADAFILCL